MKISPLVLASSDDLGRRAVLGTPRARRRTPAPWRRPALPALAVLLALSAVQVRSAEEAGGINPCTPWPLTDGLGRTAPLSGEAGPPRPGRFVGIFYFLWHQHADGRRAGGEGPYDVSKILAQDPDAAAKPDSPLWGPIGAYHYWGEPLFGYYRSTDPWVLRRHAHLLADAGVDVLICDATNALTYRDVYEKVCEVFAEVRREGGRTPQIAFMVNTNAGQTAQALYRDLYAPGLHRELWFRWHGKPLLLCDPEQASQEVRDSCTLRRAHWPFEMVNTPYAWHWEATYPQPYGYTDDPARPEQVNVSVAQNLRASDGRVTNMSEGNARGRSFHGGRRDPAPDAVRWGHNVAEQWKRAYELDPPFVMVTGWNEWIAGRWGSPGGPIVFVDQFDQEFSRDIEPMRGGHGDAYYCQLVASVRRFKGVPPLPGASAPVTIRMDGGFDAWRTVGPEYGDPVGETLPRDFAGSCGLRYVEQSGRDDIVACKVARDERRLYFHLRTREPLVSPTAAFLGLLLDADGDGATGWEGYEWAAIRTGDAEGAWWLERHDGGSTWRRTARLEARSSGSELHLAIPRAALGIPAGATRASIDFKWIAGSERPRDILEVYAKGDAAPDGRFRYRYMAD